MRLSLVFLEIFKSMSNQGVVLPQFTIELHDRFNSDVEPTYREATTTTCKNDDGESGATTMRPYYFNIA